MAKREAELTRRDEELSVRREELRRCEEQVQVLEKDQDTCEEALKSRESQVAHNEATYVERLEKANASLAEKQKKMQEEADCKVKLI